MCRFPNQKIGEHPFSRSYGVILPSSFDMVLSSALVYSTCSPVSVWGTGGTLCSLATPTLIKRLKAPTEDRFRGKPAISDLGWPFTPSHKSSPYFATYVGSVLQGLLELSSTCSWLDRSVSGQIGRTRRFHLWKAPTPNGLSRSSHFLADPSCKRYAVRFAKFEKSKERRLAAELGYGFPIGDPWITDGISPWPFASESVLPSQCPGIHPMHSFLTCTLVQNTPTQSRRKKYKSFGPSTTT
ncbi:hypothetical protein LIER_39435 [Lithospermum erythrorhizon]|uniref:Uncharacterized protein n=1 Tax=Lithospermum erythrorhizon TaxID=34254 RepID=A0AAV3QJ57_LITER